MMDSLQSKDLYLEMKCLENPDFSLIPIQDLRSALNMEDDCGTSANKLATSLTKKPELKKTVGARKPYECLTQQEETLNKLFLGVVKGSIVLWETGATINWNQALAGRVRFQYVTNFDDACFQVAYGGDRGGVLASVFFPDQYQSSLNSVFVYKGIFSKRQKLLMVSTMLYELGHVLGLRHEHSHSGVPGWIPAEDQANGAESIVWGVRNPRSVMAYYQGQQIQDSDIAAINAAYDDLEDGKIVTGKGRFSTVQKTIHLESSDVKVQLLFPVFFCVKVQMNDPGIPCRLAAVNAEKFKGNTFRRLGAEVQTARLRKQSVLEDRTCGVNVHTRQWRCP
eukprot:IDg3133t1